MLWFWHHYGLRHIHSFMNRIVSAQEWEWHHRSHSVFRTTPFIVHTDLGFIWLQVYSLDYYSFVTGSHDVKIHNTETVYCKADLTCTQSNFAHNVKMVYVEYYTVYLYYIGYNNICWSVVYL